MLENQCILYIVIHVILITYSFADIDLQEI